MRFKEVIERYQSRLFQGYGSRITSHQRNALQSIMDCRSERYGTMALDCLACEQHAHVHHACGHRSCPQCQHHDTSKWLERQQRKLLPVNYFMVTFTVPAELRSLIWQHQQQAYELLMQCVRTTLQDFAINDKHLNGIPGLTTVLHTHSRQLAFHPHVHVIVPGASVNKARGQCRKLKGQYLFSTVALAKVFRARFLAALKQATLIAPDTPAKWVVNCLSVGKGLPALKYLSKYLYRGVIRERDILADDGRQVTFGYVDSETKRYKTRTVDGEQFLWLVIQHVLPKGFRRVRDYGFLNGNGKPTLLRIQAALQVIVPRPEQPNRPQFQCSHCGGPMNITRFIPPMWRAG